jgi:NADPH:quinone reductase-like Zn-dependent oxidoreductase
MGTDTEFDAIVQLAHRGELRPMVDSVVPLAEAATALKRLAAGEQAGKLVIEVAS